MSRLKILLTGEPGSGKTTVVRDVVERLAGRVPMTGFITEEIREGGHRVGFRGVTLDGRVFPLAHLRTGGPLRVGPYGVDVAGLESIGLDALTPEAPGTWVVIDEIGKMECLSAAFKTRVRQLLDGDTPVIATVAAVGVGFVKKVRHTAGARLFTMTRRESEGMSAEIVRTISRATRSEGGRPR